MNYLFDFIGECEDVELNSGKYFLEVWGAQGGLCGSTDDKSRGGYSYGFYKIHKKTTFTVCVGEMGKIIAKDEGEYLHTNSSFNGGSRGMTGRDKECAGGGGGGTDIRIGQDLEDRIIVAGGGGGTGEYLEYEARVSGGFGGGENGGDGDNAGNGYSGLGGKSYEYENGGNYNGAEGKNAKGGKGTLGYGGDGIATARASAGGGGGGYYGGGGGADTAGGGGGSGYIGKGVFGKTIQGNQKFRSPTGKFEVGHPGNGYAKITYIIPQTCAVSRKLSSKMIFFVFVSSILK